MYKTTYKQIKWLTQSEWSQEVKDLFGELQPTMIEMAYYTPSYANWSYTVGITWLNGKCYEVVTRFGEVRGGRELMADVFNKHNTARKAGL